MKTRIKFAALMAVCCWCLPSRVAASGWTALANPPANVSTMLLLSDGSVMAQNDTGTNWYRLQPDSTGHYINGTWPNNIKAMNYTRLYYASDVLPNGEVFVAGGEATGTNSATDGSPWVEIYNPVANTWTDYGPAYFGGIADGESVVLNNGQVLVEPQDATSPYGTNTFIFDPANGTWSEATPLNAQGESSYVKLPDDSILTVDSGDYNDGTLSAERYLPATGVWTNAGTLPVSIWADLPLSHAVGETGPAFILPNGNAIFFGGSGHTAIYVGGTNWIQGPDIPNGQVMADLPGAMMNNGKIILEVCNPLSDYKGGPGWPSQAAFYVYDYSVGSTGAYNTNILAPGGGTTINTSQIYLHRMLALPDGTVLFSDDYTTVSVYQPDSAPLASGKPTIQSVSWNADGTLHLAGTLFNGISQGAAYGDDAQMDSNYPLVRFTDSDNVYYGTTFNWSSTSVQTGSKSVTTECALAGNVLTNGSVAYSMQVVANGNASDPVTIYGPVWVDFNYSKSSPQLGTFANPYSTLGQGVTNVIAGGTISIKPGVSTERLFIAKAMTINAIGGTATVGQ